MTDLVLPFLRASTFPLGSNEALLGDLALTILVGVTGVGKSTALAALVSEQRTDLPAKVLPDRRQVTDVVMIFPHAGGPVQDREERFRLTAQYRQQHSGGMAQALGSLVANTDYWGLTPIFDGLRGLDEVQYAAQTFPKWRFVALGAPDLVRVKRLLGRDDQFDNIQLEGQLEGQTTTNSASLRSNLAALKGVEQVFSPSELDELANLSTEGYSSSDILAKAKIVVSERKNYDPVAAEKFLRTLEPARALILDTLALNPSQVATSVKDWA